LEASVGLMHTKHINITVSIQQPHKNANN